MSCLSSGFYYIQKLIPRFTQKLLGIRYSDIYINLKLTLPKVPWAISNCVLGNDELIVNF